MKKQMINVYFNFKTKMSSFFVFSISIFFMLIPALLSAESLKYDFSAGGYKLIETDSGEFRIEMNDSGYRLLNSPGDPVLPEKIIELKVPQEGCITNLKLSIDSTDVETLPLQYDIASGAPAFNGTHEYWGVGKSIVKGKNIRVYGKDAFFPGEIITLLPTVLKKEPANKEGQIYKLARYIRIAFHPFAYNPVERKLTLTKKASITVSYDIKDPNDLVCNGVDPDYVIITTNAIVNGSGKLQDFVRLKESQGHSVRVVTEDDYDILTGQYPDGRAEKIRQWLINNYLGIGIDYVLLIGDPTPDDPMNPFALPAGDVPMKLCHPEYYDGGACDAPTDYFYADLVGNWDLDGDGIYGEDLDFNHPKSPSPLVNETQFSARWTGKVYIDSTSGFSFSTYSADGVRVILDGDLIIDNWTDHIPKNDKYLIPMAPTIGLHDLVVEYYHNTGDAIMRLSWSAYGDYSIIPADHLYHWDTGSSTWIPGGLDVSYFNNMDLSGTPVVNGVDIVDSIWLTGDNGPGQRQLTAQVSVGRIPVYDNDYTSLDSILLKIINYQTDQGNIDWRKSVLLPMNPLASDTPLWDVGEAIRDNIANPYGYYSYRIYDDNYASTGGPTPDLWPTTFDNVVDEWTQTEYGVVAWGTHGNTHQAMDVIDNTYLDQLNDDKPVMVFSGSCSNGCPSAIDNLGYELLKQGGIATICCSASPHAWRGYQNIGTPGEEGFYNLFYTIINYYMANSGNPMSIGDALIAMRKDFIALAMSQMVINLYGDPDCYLLKTTPPVQMKLENVYPLTQGKWPTYLTLNSNTENGKIYAQYLNTSWTSQDWIFEPVAGYKNAVRLKCKWADSSDPNKYYYLTVTGNSGSGDGDPVIGKTLNTDWASQIWIIELGRNGSIRLKSAWSNYTYLTTKTDDSMSSIVCQPNHPEWASQEWNFK